VGWREAAGKIIDDNVAQALPACDFLTVKTADWKVRPTKLKRYVEDSFSIDTKPEKH
jgi:hypothetical protein